LGDLGVKLDGINFGVVLTELMHPFLGFAHTTVVSSKLGLTAVNWVEFLGVKVNSVIGGVLQSGHSQPPHLEKMRVEVVLNVKH